MNTLLKKSIQLRPYHLAITAIVVFVCIKVMLNYVDMLMFRSEQFVVSVNINNMKQSLRMQEMMYKETDPTCQFLKNPSLFQPQLWNNISRWTYDAQHRRLTYDVLATNYFQSDIGPHIEIQFQCDKGHVTLNSSDHQWCQKPKWWGCSAYKI